MPSTRKVASDLGADPRAVASAYRELSASGLVVLAPRSGAYLSTDARAMDTAVQPSDAWLVDIIANGIFHGSSLKTLAERVDGIAGHRKLKVVVIALTIDQALGLSRELHEDFGLETSYILESDLSPDLPVPRSVRGAQMLVTTERCRELVEKLAKLLKSVALVVGLRPDVILPEWVMLLQHPVYVVGMDTRLLDLIKAYLRDVPGSENMVMVVAGHDDLSKIPADAPTYVTEAARRFLGKTNIPGRLIKPGKLLDRDSVRRLTELIVAMDD